MKNYKRIIRQIFKYGALFMTVLFTAVACGYSFIETGKTQEDVEHFVPDDVKETDKVIPLEEIKITFDKNFDSFYQGEVITYNTTLVPSNATNKNIVIDIPKTVDDKPAFKINHNTREIECLETGKHKLVFRVENEKPIYEKEFNVIDFNVPGFEILDKNDNIITDTDIFVDKVNDSEPTIIKMHVDDKKILDRMPLMIRSSDKEIIDFEALGNDEYQIIPKKIGTVKLSFELKNIIKSVYVTNEKLSSDSELKCNPFYYGTLTRFYMYFRVPDIEALDPKRVRVEFEHPQLFKRIRIGNSKTMNGLEIICESSEKYINEVKEPFFEKFRAFYDYPGGTTVELNPGKNKIEIRPGYKLDKTYYRNLPKEGSPIEFGTLVNSKNECFQNDFTYKFSMSKVDRVNLNNYKFEVLSNNADEIDISKSTYKNFNIIVKNGINPSNYRIRFIFDKDAFDIMNANTYVDFDVKFSNFTSIPLDDGCIFDFKYLYGELDKNADGVIPQNFITRVELNNIYNNYVGDYIVKNKDGKISPIFLDGGIIVEPVNDDALNYYIGYENKNKLTGACSTFTLTHKCNKKLELVRVQDHPIFRVTSPVFEFFGVEPIWTTIDFIMDEVPEYFNYTIYKNDKKISDEVIKGNKTYNFNLENEDELKTSCKTSYESFKSHQNAYAKNLSDRSSVSVGALESAVSDVTFGSADSVYFVNNRFYAVAPGKTEATLNYCRNWKTNEPAFKVNFDLNVAGKAPVCTTNTILPKDIKIETQYNHSSNDYERGIVQINRNFRLSANGISDEDLLKDFDIEIIQGSIKNGKDKLEFIPEKRGYATILIQHKVYKIIQKTIDLLVTNSTSDFKIEKGHFEAIKVDPNTKEILIDSYDKRDYKFNFTPLVESSSTYYKFEPVENCNGIIEFQDNNIVSVLKEGTAKFKVIYGDENNNEETFEKIVTMKVKNASAYHSNISYKTRKLIGHFGLFACLGFSVMCFFTMWLFDKKYWNFVLVPGSMAYSYLIAYISEFIQGFIPSRCFAMSDVLLNFEGALMGIGLMLVGYLTYIGVNLIRKNRKRKKSTIAEEDN